MDAEDYAGCRDLGWVKRLRITVPKTERNFFPTKEM